MATINLGRVKLVNRGTWSSANTYAIDDFVQYTDSGVLSTYIAVAASTNQVPSTSGTENASFWKFMSKGTAVNVGNNKVVTSDGSGNLQGLSIGTAGQALKVNSSANGYEFGSAGGVLQTVHAKTNTRYNISGNGTTTVTDLTANITPSSASNKILVTVALYWGGGNNSYGSFRLRRTIGGSDTFPDHLNGTANGSAVQGIVPASNVQGANQEHKMWSGVKVGYDNTHNTTNQITYTVTMHCQGSAGFQMNRTHNDASNNNNYNTSVHSTLTLQEVL